MDGWEETVTSDEQSTNRRALSKERKLDGEGRGRFIWREFGSWRGGSGFFFFSFVLSFKILFKVRFKFEPKKKKNKGKKERDA